MTTPKWITNFKKLVKNEWKKAGLFTLIGFAIGLLTSTGMHTANVNLQNYAPFGSWSDFDMDVMRLRDIYNDNYNFTFDVFVSNNWYVSKVARIKVSTDTSNNKIKCSYGDKPCDEIYRQIPAQGESLVEISPFIEIGDFSDEEIKTDGFNLCIYVIDDNNHWHTIQNCKQINILDTK